MNNVDVILGVICDMFIYCVYIIIGEWFPIRVNLNIYLGDFP